MKYISCLKCGHYVSDQTSACPACGESVNEIPAAAETTVRNISNNTAVATQKEHNMRSWVKKLWYGEYSLSTVFWLFGVLASISAWCLWSILSIVLVDAKVSFKIFMIIVYLLVIIASAYNITWIVGAWRTAKKHRGSGIIKFLFRIWICLVTISTFLLIYRVIR